LWLIIIALFPNSRAGAEAHIDLTPPIVFCLMALADLLMDSERLKDTEWLRYLRELDEQARKFFLQLAGVPHRLDLLTLELARAKRFSVVDDVLRRSVSEFIDVHYGASAAKVSNGSRIGAAITRSTSLYISFSEAKPYRRVAAFRNIEIWPLQLYEDALR